MDLQYPGQWGRDLTKGNIKELCPITMDGVAKEEKRISVSPL